MYEIRTYRTHEDWQHCRMEVLKESLGCKNLNWAIANAKVHCKNSKDYQVMVFSGESIVFACKYVYGGTQDFYFVGGERFSKFKSALLVLYKILEEKYGYARFELCEENGVISIKELWGDRYFIKDVFGGNVDVGIVDAVISVIGKCGIISKMPVKKLIFCDVDKIDKLYLTSCKDEAGTVEVYADWF